MKTNGAIVCAVTIVASMLSGNAEAQSDPLIGTWQLNLAQSKYDPGPTPQNNTMHYETTPQGARDTSTGVNALGTATTSVFTMVYDGQFHPTKGVVGYDSSAFTRVDDYTVIYVRTLAGKVVGSGTRVLSRDGKTLTFTGIGVNADGKPYRNVVVYDKQ